MFRGSLVFLAGAAAAVMMGQAPNPQGANAPLNVRRPNILEPLVFFSSDFDLNDDGKMDQNDIVAAHSEPETEAFQTFRDQLVSQLNHSAERRGNNLQDTKKHLLDMFAKCMIRWVVRDPGGYRILVYWSRNEQCEASWGPIDQETFEQIKKGELIYQLNHKNQVWEQVLEPGKPVIVRLKPTDR